ncbi:MAG TPA: M23 family metallopeptidase [Thermoanaerobaculia bacterium]
MRLRLLFVSTLCSLALTACSSLAPLLEPEPIEVVVPEIPLEDDLSGLVSQLRMDHGYYIGRERERLAKIVVPRQTAPARKSIAPRMAQLVMPVVGVDPTGIEDNFGASRDGGRRSHRGIDIFARRGTKVVAVADGYITFVGNQPKGGRCIWLETDDRRSFFYAHLDRWANGLYEGMAVRAGDFLGYVGNTGNARRTPAHLHFVIVDDDEAVNPYPLLRRSMKVATARPLAVSGALGGSQ